MLLTYQNYYFIIYVKYVNMAQRAYDFKGDQQNMAYIEL